MFGILLLSFTRVLSSYSIGSASVWGKMMSRMGLVRKVAGLG